ncbi:MAG: CGGC domain-containing protein [Desulfobacterales bacterium]
MKKVAIVACGSYADQGYGCPGEWRCLKAATLGEGLFDEESQVVAFLMCECPGRPIMSNMGMTLKSLEFKPDAIHLSSCMVNAKPGCPYMDPEELARDIENKFGIPVVLGTHQYA